MIFNKYYLFGFQRRGTKFGRFLHKDLEIGEETFKIGTELNETIIEKISTVVFVMPI